MNELHAIWVRVALSATTSCDVMNQLWSVAVSAINDRAGLLAIEIFRVLEGGRWRSDTHQAGGHQAHAGDSRKKSLTEVLFHVSLSPFVEDS